MNTISLLSGSNIDEDRITHIKSTKIFSFDIESHRFLEKINLKHFLADELLNELERERIFEHSISKSYWFENSSFSNSLFLDGINILEMIDPLQLHQKLIVNLIQFSIIKKILRAERPMKVYATRNLTKIISCLDDKIEVISVNCENTEIFENFDIRIRVFSRNIKLKISMKRLEKLQTLFESCVGRLFNFWLDVKIRKPIILLLEFDPSKFENLFMYLNTPDSEFVILNRRKSALWNFKSIQIMKKSKAKIINFNRLLSNEERQEILNLQKKYKSILDNFWNEDHLEKIFSYDGDSYWVCIRDFLIKQYQNEIFNYIRNSIEAKALFQKLHIKCILYQYESGNSENSTLSRRGNVPALLLRHGFSAYTKKTAELRWKYDSFRLVKLNCEQIMMWGDSDFEYYSNYLPNSKKLKIIGSPRHDEFFIEEK